MGRNISAIGAILLASRGFARLIRLRGAPLGVGVDRTPLGGN